MIFLGRKITGEGRGMISSGRKIFFLVRKISDQDANGAGIFYAKAGHPVP
jgi:hypothetical protein